MAIHSVNGDSGCLSAEAVAAFTLITAGDDPTPVMPDAVAELEALGVVVRDGLETNRPIALDPGAVVRKRLEIEFQNAADCLARMRGLPQAAEHLAEAYDRSRLHAGGRSEYIPDPRVVNARLERVVGEAESEILAAQPSGPRTREQLEGAAGRDTAALDRGVAKRTLYRASVRDNSVTAEYARTMSARTVGRSAEFRTLEEPFERLIVVDRKTAFISDTIVPGSHPNAAWQITDGAFVAHLVAEFETRWRRADPWNGQSRTRSTGTSWKVPDGVRTTPRQREVMREMIDGRSQQATATRLGISVRTVSEEITALKDLFGARSREQLSYLWGFAPDRLVDDGTVIGGTSAGPSGAASAGPAA